MATTGATMNHEPTLAKVQLTDGLGPAAEARWYCVSREGMATLCCDEANAQAEAQKQQDEYPRSGPYIAMRLVDAAELDRLRETLKLQQASYEREIALDVAAERERWKAARLLTHDYQGLCPDENNGWDARDMECPACRALVDLGA